MDAQGLSERPSLEAGANEIAPSQAPSRESLSDEAVASGPPDAERPSEPLPISEERAVENAERAESELPAAQTASGGGRSSSRVSGSVRPPSPDRRPLSGRSERPGSRGNRPSGPARLGERSSQSSRSGAPSSQRPRAPTPVIAAAARSKSTSGTSEPATVRATSVPPRAIAALAPTMLDMPAPLASRAPPVERAPVALPSRPAPLESGVAPIIESSSPPSAEPAPDPSPRSIPSADVRLVPGEAAAPKDLEPAARGDWSSVLDSLDAGGGW